MQSRRKTLTHNKKQNAFATWAKAFSISDYIFFKTLLSYFSWNAIMPNRYNLSRFQANSSLQRLASSATSTQ